MMQAKGRKYCDYIRHVKQKYNGFKLRYFIAFVRPASDMCSLNINPLTIET